MNSKLLKYTLAAAILASTADAINISNAGIFDKLYKEEAEAAAAQKEKEDAIQAKKIQLAEAEKEHERLVKEEEEEDKKKEEAEQKAFEERELMQRQLEADKRKAQMMAEIDRENVALRSHINMAQINLPGDGEFHEHEGIVFTNQVAANEKVANPISSIIGSGPVPNYWEI